MRAEERKVLLEPAAHAIHYLGGPVADQQIVSQAYRGSLRRHDQRGLRALKWVSAAELALQRPLRRRS